MRKLEALESPSTAILKICFFAATLFIIGCDEQKARDRARAERTLVLECSGSRIDPASSEREPASYLIRIDPFNQSQHSLHFFDSKEKMFVSPCEEQFAECKVSSSPDLITEYGATRGSNSQVILGQMTEINRRTGNMRIVMASKGDVDRAVFDGSCKKSDMPTENPPKF